MEYIIAEDIIKEVLTRYYLAIATDAEDDFTSVNDALKRLLLAKKFFAQMEQHI